MSPSSESSPAAPPSAPRPRFSWLLLLACLLAPALLTSLTVLIDHSSRSPAPGVAIAGGLLGGIGCGVILGRRLGRTAPRQILFGLIFVGIGTIASITLATFGCLASGYQLDFR